MLLSTTTTLEAKRADLDGGAGAAGRARAARLEAGGRRRRLVSILLAFALGTALAQTSLYGPEAPADMAFLRVINASAGPVTAAVADGEEAALLPGEGSDYVPVPGGEAAFSLRRGEGEPEVVTTEVGREEFATLLVLPEGFRVLRDEVLLDISRGLLVFVNATGSGPLSLRLNDGTMVFEDVGDEPESRTIAEAEAEFEVVDPADGEVVATVPARTYERGAAHTILVHADQDGPAVSYLPASLAD